MMQRYYLLFLFGGPAGYRQVVQDAEVMVDIPSKKWILTFVWKKQLIT